MSVAARGVRRGAFTATETIGQRAGVDALHDRLLDLARQLAADGRHLAADVLRRDLVGTSDAELDDDVREALLRRGLDVADALDGVDRLPRCFFVTSRSTVSGDAPG